MPFSFDFGLKDKLLRAVKSKAFYAAILVAVAAYLSGTGDLGELITAVLKAIGAA